MFAGCFPVAVQFPSENPGQRAPEYDILTRLAYSAASFVKDQVKTLGHKRRELALSAAPLVTLPVGTDLATRVQLAATSTVPAVLFRLAGDEDASVRNALIFNPALPADLLANLALDEDRFVSAQARARLGQLAA